MSTGTRAARRLALTALLGATLTACSLFPGQQPAQAPTRPPGETPNIPGQSYPGPGTPTVPPTAGAATATTVATAPATAVPPTTTLVAPTVAPPAVGLLGPEWIVAYSGDLNGDGRADALGWAPASGVPKGPTFNQPLYTAYLGPASQVVIVQAGQNNRPQVQLLATTTQLSAGATNLYTFDAARRPSGFMLKVTPGNPVLLDLIQVNASGEPAAQGIGIRWDRSALAYRIAGPGGK
ncbi:MAG TPA: hypothetical protein VNL77_24875 [Roseiflexaceae bacterium]|nr:hypothetical protein [Roseiflexaceae bacterium]